MEEPLIRVEDVLNGKYRYVEGQPVRRSYVDKDMKTESKCIKVKDLKEYIKDIPDETRVLIRTSIVVQNASSMTYSGPMGSFLILRAEE